MEGGSYRNNRKPCPCCFSIPGFTGNPYNESIIGRYNSESTTSIYPLDSPADRMDHFSRPVAGPGRKKEYRRVRVLVSSANAGRYNHGTGRNIPSCHALCK